MEMFKLIQFIVKHFNFYLSEFNNINAQLPYTVSAAQY